MTNYENKEKKCNHEFISSSGEIIRCIDIMTNEDACEKCKMEAQNKKQCSNCKEGYDEDVFTCDVDNGGLGLCTDCYAYKLYTMFDEQQCEKYENGKCHSCPTILNKDTVNFFIGYSCCAECYISQIKKSIAKGKKETIRCNKCTELFRIPSNKSVIAVDGLVCCTDCVDEPVDVAECYDCKKIYTCDTMTIKNNIKYCYECSHNKQCNDCGEFYDYSDFEYVSGHVRYCEPCNRIRLHRRICEDCNEIFNEDDMIVHDNFALCNACDEVNNFGDNDDEDIEDFETDEEKAERELVELINNTECKYLRKMIKKFRKEFNAEYEYYKDISLEIKRIKSKAKKNLEKNSSNKIIKRKIRNYNILLTFYEPLVEKAERCMEITLKVVNKLRYKLKKYQIYKKEFGKKKIRKECTICFKKGNIMTLKCQHILCIECLCNIEKKCPYCRKEIECICVSRKIKAKKIKY